LRGDEMEDRTFELLSQLYSDMTKQFLEINHKLDQKADKNDIVRIENEFNPKSEALFDGYKQLSEGQEKILNSIQSLELKMDNQDVQITVLRKAK